jgi:Haem-binding domain
MKKKIFLAVLSLLIIIQFIRPAKNISDDRTWDISTKYYVPVQVSSILQAACKDCHSNKTDYPWYAEVQPMGWWLNKHVTDGKKDLNFSSFTKLPIAVQNHKLEEVIEMVKEEEMPLPSYTYLGLHAEANLSNEQRELIVRWAEHQMDSLKTHYPPDSLVMKRRSAPQGS